MDLGPGMMPFNRTDSEHSWDVLDGLKGTDEILRTSDELLRQVDAAVSDYSTVRPCAHNPLIACSSHRRRSS